MYVQLTPTPRLARNQARLQATHKRAEGLNAWYADPILSLNAWLATLRNEYHLSNQDPRIPIDNQQAQAIWQSVINHEVFIGEPEVAGLALQAWRTVHEHLLPHPSQWSDLSMSRDNRQFQLWVEAYEQVCREQGLIDEWQFANILPELIAQQQIQAPSTIRLLGFEMPIAPIYQSMLAACEAQGTKIIHSTLPAMYESQIPIAECSTPDEELIAAARWARQTLETDTGLSIAIVVPDLTGRVDRVDRILRQVFDPHGFVLRSHETEPWHISLGKTLSNWPLISEALAMLYLNPGKMSQPQATTLLRSPYLTGADGESFARAKCLYHLNQRAPYYLTVSELQWSLEQADAPALVEALSRWQETRHTNTHTQWPSEWAALFDQELRDLGFAQGRTLDSREYQLRQRWQALLEQFSTLDVAFTKPVTRMHALNLISERAGNSVFRELNPGVPLEIMGVEEALGSSFDAIWITSLNSEHWPGPARRDPLIPTTLQKGLPNATSESALALAKVKLRGLLRTAPVITGSFVNDSDDASRHVTPLLDNCRVESAEHTTVHADAEFAPSEPDQQGPQLELKQVSGGTAVLRHQSSCPFRAFAEHRLQARDATPPRPGLNPGQRGTILHDALEHFWSDLYGSGQLAELDREKLNARVDEAVEIALVKLTKDYRHTLSAAGLILERRRAVRLLVSWLALEEQRQAFRVLEHEAKISIELAGFTLRGSIDRIDLLADNSIMIIDYKTGLTNKTDWLPIPRMVDPQLPAYAVSMASPPGVISFATLRPELIRFDGLAKDDPGVPGLKPLEQEGYAYKEKTSWDDLLNAWQVQLQSLAETFATGYAAVDPRDINECKQCHLHSLCRIVERTVQDDLIETATDE